MRVHLHLLGWKVHADGAVEDEPHRVRGLRSESPETVQDEGNSSNRKVNQECSGGVSDQECYQQ